MGTVQKQSGDLLADKATLFDQLQEGIFDFDMQELLEFMSEVALGSGVDEGFQSGKKIAPAREPHRLTGPQTQRIKLWNLGECVEAAPMGVAGAIGEFFQLAKYGCIDGGAQGLLQFGQGSNSLRLQEFGT